MLITIYRHDRLTYINELTSKNNVLSLNMMIGPQKLRAK